MVGGGDPSRKDLAVQPHGDPLAGLEHPDRIAITDGRIVVPSAPTCQSGTSSSSAAQIPDLEFIAAELLAQCVAAAAQACGLVFPAQLESQPPLGQGSPARQKMSTPSTSRD